MIVAILGKTASGKSEVMTILKNKGFYCIYGDKITRELYKKGGEGQKKIKKCFGKEFLIDDGDVDRYKLKELVFNSPSKLKLLNKLIHPLVYDEIKSRIRAIKKGTNIVIELFYLDDEELLNMIDKVIWVDRSLKLIEKTLVLERGFTKVLAKKVAKLAKRPKRVNFVIKNNGDFSALDFLVTKALGL